MNTEEFKKNIHLYGTNIDEWPLELREDANRLLLSSLEFQNIIKEENILNDALNHRGFEEASPSLENRIISTALSNSAHNSKSIFEFLNQIFNSFHLPNPAFALSLVLLIGITLGYAVDNIGIENNNENLFANEINFYDGDFYE